MKHSSTPAYSIGAKYPAEPVTTNKLAPSPDTYNVRSEVIVVPSTKFARAGRSVSENCNGDVPGPGSYCIPTFVDQVVMAQRKRPVLQLKERRERVKVESPGAGSYNPQSPVSSLSFSMGSRTYGLVSNEPATVSPDNYSPNYKSIEAVKPISFTKAQRETEGTVKNNPGPGYYDVSYFQESPKYKFPSQERGKITDHNYPSPFEYNILGFTEDKGGRNGVTILPKREIPRRDEWVPGPGSYDAKLPQIFPTFSIGKGKRPDLTPKITTPGPGEYSPKASNSPCKSMGNGKRPPINPESNVPGPGAYEMPSFTSKGPKYSLVARRDESKKEIGVPGPGQYSPEFKNAKGKSFSASMGSAKRKFEEDTRKIPGPGSYELGLSKDSPNWTFKKGKRAAETKTDVPGPGQYEYYQSVPDIPKYLKTK